MFWRGLENPPFAMVSENNRGEWGELDKWGGTYVG